MARSIQRPGRSVASKPEKTRPAKLNATKIAALSHGAKPAVEGAGAAGATCLVCRKRLKQPSRGRPRKFCSPQCRLLAHRASLGERETARATDSAEDANRLRGQLAEALAQVEVLKRRADKAIKAAVARAEAAERRVQDGPPRDTFDQSTHLLIARQAEIFERDRADKWERRARAAVEATNQLKEQLRNLREQHREMTLELLVAQRALEKLNETKP